MRRELFCRKSLELESISMKVQDQRGRIASKGELEDKCVAK